MILAQVDFQPVHELEGEGPAPWLMAHLWIREEGATEPHYRGALKLEPAVVETIASARGLLERLFQDAGVQLALSGAVPEVAPDPMMASAAKMLGTMKGFLSWRRK